MSYGNWNWDTMESIPAVCVPAPTPEPIHDPTIDGWYYVDADGIAYYGNTPGECYAQAAEGARIYADHMRQWQNRPEHYRDDEGETPCQKTG
jgi:hypothetical protein